MSGSCNFFPIAIHTVDQHADFISTKAENTSGGGGNVVGGPSNATSPAAQSGVGIQIDGSGTSSCFQNRLISPVLGFFDTAIAISANCMSNMTVGATYASNFPTLPASVPPPTVDSGLGDMILDQNGFHLGKYTHLTASGADVAGTATTTSGSIFPLTFDTNFNMTPVCTPTATSNATMWVTGAGVSGVTFNSSAPGVTFNYHCIGNPN
jgi:hypothetical protein